MPRLPIQSVNRALSCVFERARLHRSSKNSGLERLVSVQDFSRADRPFIPILPSGLLVREGLPSGLFQRPVQACRNTEAFALVGVGERRHGCDTVPEGPLYLDTAIRELL